MWRRGQVLLIVLIGIVVVLAAAAMMWFVIGDAPEPRPVAIATVASTPGNPLTPDELSEAEDLFVLRCAACHGSDGGGIVGPSLLDDEWIHSRDLDTIRSGLITGYPDKGMPSQKEVMTDDEITLVARYVLSLSAEAP